MKDWLPFPAKGVCEGQTPTIVFELWGLSLLKYCKPMFTLHLFVCVYIAYLGEDSTLTTKTAFVEHQLNSKKRKTMFGRIVFTSEPSGFHSFFLFLLYSIPGKNLPFWGCWVKSAKTVKQRCSNKVTVACPY